MGGAASDQLAHQENLAAKETIVSSQQMFGTVTSASSRTTTATSGMKVRTSPDAEEKGYKVKRKDPNF